MTLMRKAAQAQTEDVGPRQIRVICSSQQVDRMGEVVMQDGIDLSAFRSNPVVLWSHDPTQPIGRASNITLSSGNLQADVEFAPMGISPIADQICGLVKAGIVNTVSIGFQPTETEPMDPSRPRGPQRYLRSSLMELSLVSVPANTDANVIARAAADWTVGAARDLPIDKDSAWDGPAAAASIFDWAGGDDFDASKAKEGFLVYDAGSPKLRGSYKLPFAKVVDGKLTALKSGIDAAASRLPQTDIPDEVRGRAQAVVDAYQEKAGEKTDDTSKAAPAVDRGKVARFVAGIRRKDLYDLGSLASVLGYLGYIVDDAAWEAAMEGDGSKVPAMLAEAMQAVAAALLAMADEEVAEALADAQADVAGNFTVDDLGLGLMAAETPLAKALGITRFVARAGRVLSAANEADLRSAHEKIGGVLSQVGSTQSDDPDPDAAEKAAAVRRREVEYLELTAR